MVPPQAFSSDASQHPQGRITWSPRPDRKVNYLPPAGRAHPTTMRRVIFFPHNLLCTRHDHLSTASRMSCSSGGGRWDTRPVPPPANSCKTGNAAPHRPPHRGAPAQPPTRRHVLATLPHCYRERTTQCGKARWVTRRYNRRDWDCRLPGASTPASPRSHLPRQSTR